MESPGRPALLRTLWFLGGATALCKEAAAANPTGVRVAQQVTFSNSSAQRVPWSLDAGVFMEPSRGHLVAGDPWSPSAGDGTLEIPKALATVFDRHI